MRPLKKQVQFIKEAVSAALMPKAMVVSYPKCGKTWIANVLFHYLSCKSGCDKKNDLFDLNPDFKALSRNRDVGQIIFSHDVFSRGAPLADWHTLSAVRFHKRENKALLIRDPRDILVSLYWHMMGREHKSGLPSDLSIGDFIRSYERGVDGLIVFFNIWAQAARERADIRVFRYEDFLGDWKTNNVTWKDFVGYITKQPVSSALLEASVEHYKIDNLKIEIGVNRTDLTGIGGRIRSGRSGGYQSALSIDDLDFVNSRLESHLSQHSKIMLASYMRF